MSNISVSSGWVYKDGRQVGQIIGNSVLYAGSSGSGHRQGESIGSFDWGSGIVYGRDGWSIGMMDNFGNVYRKGNGFPILERCSSIQLAAAYLLFGS